MGMDGRKVGDILFSLLALLTALALLVFGYVLKRAGHIWSWEGFLREYLSLETGLQLGIVVLLAVCLLAAVQWKLLFGKWYRRIRWLCLCAAAAAALAMFPRDIPLEARWFEKHCLVAHAGGISPNGNAYANTLEAFESNYQKGHRVFEGDLSFTADGVLVLEHDWKFWCWKAGLEYSGDNITYEQFMGTKLFGTETPIDLAGLIELMTAHRDMYFMTDFKECYDQEEVVAGFQQLVRAAEDAGHSEILDRVIVQNQHNEFKHWVEEFYPFENWLYTFYSIPNEEDRQPENLASYCEREGIPVLTMWEYMPNEEWFETMEPHDIKIFVHTVNDAARANELIAAGVTGIYTDSITPDQIPPTGW